MRPSPGSLGVGAYTDHGPTCPVCCSAAPGHVEGGAACRAQRADQAEQQAVADRETGYAPRGTVLPPDPLLDVELWAYVEEEQAPDTDRSPPSSAHRDRLVVVEVCDA